MNFISLAREPLPVFVYMNLPPRRELMNNKKNTTFEDIQKCSLSTNLRPEGKDSRSCVRVRREIVHFSQFRTGAEKLYDKQATQVYVKRFMIAMCSNLCNRVFSSE